MLQAVGGPRSAGLQACITAASTGSPEGRVNKWARRAERELQPVSCPSENAVFSHLTPPAQASRTLGPLGKRLTNRAATASSCSEA